VVYVTDASRAVGVAGQLVSEELHDDFVTRTAAEYARLRERRASRNRAAKLRDLQSARELALPVQGASPAPRAPGIHELSPPLDALTTRIDWTPFFHAWELRGTWPRILSDGRYGAEARKLLADAETLLARIVDEDWLQARGVVGLFPARRVGDDIEVLSDDRQHVRGTLHTLRQQQQHLEHCLALADFVQPSSDWIGAFAVTAGLGVEGRVKALEAAHDDYHAILLKAVADRLAEAFAEWLHEHVRKVLWGYAPDESLSLQELIKERYDGIRPAPGYPAQPDHTEKRTLWSLLGVAERTGIELTDSCAMWPAASVSGLYLAHPDSRYFGVGAIGRDQVADYAERKGWSLAEAERWLSPVLAYDP
jgi:5-methyltetrahydrofolate--homocysteine methyltransferase